MGAAAGAAGARPARRAALAAGLGAALLARGAAGPAPARAGALLDRRRAELARTRELLAADPESQLLAAQQYLLQNEVERVAGNAEFVAEARGRFDGGEGGGAGGYFARVRLRVPDLAREVRFWTRGLGMAVVRGSPEEGACAVGYAPESLAQEDGGGFALELTGVPPGLERPGGARGGGGALAFLQVALPNMISMSKVDEAGGEILSGYGWLRIRSPGGVDVRAYVGRRRDPVELVALRDDGPPGGGGVAFYRGLGMAERPVPVPEDLFSPSPPEGSRLLCFGDEAAETGLLLLAPEAEAGGSRGPGVLQGLSIVTASGGTAVRDPAGDAVEVLDLAGFQAGLPPADIKDLTLAGVPALRL